MYYWIASPFQTTHLIHSSDEVVDPVLSVTSITTLVEVRNDGVESLLGGAKFECPQESVGFLEVGSDRVNFVDEIFDANNALLAESLFNNSVVVQRDTGALDFTETTLQNQLSDRLQVGVTPGNVGLYQSEHLEGGTVELDEDSIVDLSQSQQLQNLLDSGANSVDTSDTDNESQLSLRFNEEVTSVSGGSALRDQQLL